MKIRSLPAFAGLAISFALPAFGQEKDPAVDPQIVQQLHAIGNVREGNTSRVCMSTFSISPQHPTPPRPINSSRIRADSSLLAQEPSLFQGFPIVGN